jgi:hypothetical protein
VTGVGVASELASWPEQGAEMPASMVFGWVEVGT